jgi:hypothetical protein
VRRPGGGQPHIRRHSREAPAGSRVASSLDEQKIDHPVAAIHTSLNSKRVISCSADVGSLARGHMSHRI